MFLFSAPFNFLLKSVMRQRMSGINRMREQPLEVQEQLFKNLLQRAKNTEWGQKYKYSEIHNQQQFSERVPSATYEEFFPLIERVMRGEKNVTWPGQIKWFSKSSGTTNARSKFIPVTKESLEQGHYRAGKDLLAMYTDMYPQHKLFTGKGLSLGGSHQPNELQPDSRYGDVSAVIMENLPGWAQAIRAPELPIALMDKWEEKIQRIIETTQHENITSLAGVPTWTYVLIHKMLEATGKKYIREVWPNLELFAHGAVAFGPYRQVFKDLIPQPGMHYMEQYNASEGFFGIQDQRDSEDMLLLLNHGVYYEFIPIEQVDYEQPKTISLADVKLGESYALMISTNSGLWRYRIGDTVKFTSISPYRIRITGRTKHFINAFGEEVVVENAEAAIAEASEKTHALVTDFTAAPVYLEGGKRGGHEWLIEFKKAPDNFGRFIEVLDQKLREINSDYDAKRQNDLALALPQVKMVPTGTFYEWMRSKNKLGGQHKVPRLYNTREIVEEILKIIG